MKKKLLSAILVLAVLILPLAICGCKGSRETVRFLNYDTELDGIYEELAKEYEKETGVKVKVQTATIGSYAQALKTQMNMKDAPTVFRIEGVSDFEDLKDSLLDLSDTKLYSNLFSKDLAFTGENGDEVYGIPYNITAYGIIYNEEITDKYFALENRNNDYNSMADIRSFEAFRKVVTDMSNKRKELGIDGVFASTLFSSGEDSWLKSLLNPTLYYEFEQNDDYKNPQIAAFKSKEIDLRYSENHRNILDLYTENSVKNKEMADTLTFDDAISEFAAGKAVMFEGKIEDFEKISKISNKKVNDGKIKFLPIYTGINGEENSGLSVESKGYLVINNKVSEAEQKQTIDFLNWLFSSEKGKKYVTEKLEFLTPFKTFTEYEISENPLSRETLKYMEDSEVSPVPVIVNSFPSGSFVSTVKNALLDYLKGNKTYPEAEKTIKEKWKDERK